MVSFKKAHPRAHKFLKGAGTAINIATKAFQIASTVASVINSEKKYFDTTITVAPDTTASITHLSAIAQGDTKSDRNGDSVAIKSIQINTFLTGDSAAPLEGVRVILFRDNNNNLGTPPTAAQLLENPTNIMSLRCMDYSDRFTVIKDKLLMANASTNWSRHQKFYLFKRFKPMKDRRGLKIRNHHITWTGTAGGDEAKGHLYLLVLGNTATASTTSSLGGYSRIRYYDN